MKNPYDMTPDEIRRAAAAIEFLEPVWSRHQELYRQHCDQGLSTHESFRRAARALVDEYGDPLVQAIHDLHDARIRTREGVYRYLLRDVVDLKARKGVTITP